ncbi:MAG: hypothetical protein ACRD01_06050 [Terriglobales bacterium]
MADGSQRLSGAGEPGAFPAPAPAGTVPASGFTASGLKAVAPPPLPPPLPLAAWLGQRRTLVELLEQELRDGFQAVAAFDAPRYLDCIERQEGLCQSIARLDRRLPAPTPDKAFMEAAAAELRRMNAELKTLADVQQALIEHGSRSVRSFQRVWAMAAPGYAVTPAPGGRHEHGRVVHLVSASMPALAGPALEREG